MQLRKTRWSIYNLNYHFVWIPKYRKKILKHICQTSQIKNLENGLRMNMINRFVANRNFIKILI